MSGKSTFCRALVSVTLVASMLVRAQAEGEPGPPRPPSGGPQFESQPLPGDDAEKKILEVLDDMDRNQQRGMMNVPKDDGRLLRLLTEAIDAKHVVEIGTSDGYSGIWFCLALRKTGGRRKSSPRD